MDWLLGHTSSAARQPAPHNGLPPAHPPRPGIVVPPAGDPTFLYGGYGYRPTLGYAWLNGCQAPASTSFAHLPSADSPKGLSKSVSAPDLQNREGVEGLQQAQAGKQTLKQQAQQTLKQQEQAAAHATPPPPARPSAQSGHASAAGTPQQHSAAGTPAGSHAPTPRPHRLSDSGYIGLAAA